MQWVPFWPNSAAISSHAVDTLFIGELALTIVVLISIFGLMIFWGVRYRRGSSADRGDQVKKSWHWEIGWTSATLVAFLALFVWGANLYIYLYKVPRHTDMEIYVVGKQWMWKIEHAGGQREIDQLHVPVDKTVKVVLASEDVIHSFYIPAFRLKHDVVPGQYETFWFKPTETGVFRIECTQYCGTQHAHMIGQVFVMTPADYQRWLTSLGASETLAQQGEALFRHYGCSGCHGANSTIHAPSLVGLYGSIVHLSDGGTAVADERYIRDSILLPRSQIVAGYAPIMPSFAGQIGEDDLLKLVAYIQSLSSGSGTRQ